MIVGVIPARHGSSRFPGKMLTNILGKSLIQRTYENALRCSGLDLLVIATDDERIMSHALDFGAKCFMTSKNHKSGTDRVESLIASHFPEASIVVNIQGDEPCLSPQVIEVLIKKLQNTPEALITTPVAKITDPSEIFNPASVKCVFDINGRAMYFSRAPIPFPKNCEKIHDYYRHLGVYCFKNEFLKKYSSLPYSRLQEIEDLEQLKILESGHPLYVCIVQDESIGVDTPEDVQKIEELLCQENTSLLQAASSPL